MLTLIPDEESRRPAGEKLVNFGYRGWEISPLG